MSDWPGSNDYTIAIQSPSVCFRDADLKHASLERNKLTRMPKVWTGNFAQVYELRNSSSRWAVKCFTRSATDIRLRYSQLAQAIAATRLPYFVEFKFIDSEILVNGRRYPIVKMQWVEGQSLDKFVEANLYQSQVLLDAAARLAQLVNDLEQHQLAHGDLQHGNIVMTNTGIKLVDYDGMFIPAFSGRPAPECGLPSYQHPRRCPADYAIGLDRFSLLVLCTGLCALAVEPTLWYEFNTGDNLLFTADDFRNPAASRLLNRLTNAGDSQVKKYAESLIQACSRPPLSVLLPASSISKSITQPTRWWVTALATEVKTRIDKDPATRADEPELFTAVTAARSPGHWRAMTLFALGCVAVAAVWLANGFIAFIIGAVGVAALFLENRSAYRRLPVLARQRELQARIREAQKAVADLEKRRKNAEQRLSTLVQQESSERSQEFKRQQDSLRHELQHQIDQTRAALADAENRKRTAELQVSSLNQQEAAELTQELQRLQAAHIAAYLSGIDISRLTEIKGIGRHVVGNFRASGIHNAGQLKYRGPYAHGVGAQRRQAVQAKLLEWERAGSRGMLQQLPSAPKSRIEAKYASQRQSVMQQIAGLTQRLGALGPELRQAEWRLTQVGNTKLLSTTEARIEAKYGPQRQGVTKEIGAFAQRLGALGSELRQAEWNLKQIRVPTFRQFVRHSF